MTVKNNDEDEKLQKLYDKLASNPVDFEILEFIRRDMKRILEAEKSNQKPRKDAE